MGIPTYIPESLYVVSMHMVSFCRIGSVGSRTFCPPLILSPQTKYGRNTCPVDTFPMIFSPDSSLMSADQGRLFLFSLFDPKG